MTCTFSRPFNFGFFVVEELFKPYFLSGKMDGTVTQYFWLYNYIILYQMHVHACCNFLHVIFLVCLNLFLYFYFIPIINLTSDLYIFIHLLTKFRLKFSWPLNFVILINSRKSPIKWGAKYNGFTVLDIDSHCPY